MLRLPSTLSYLKTVLDQFAELSSEANYENVDTSALESAIGQRVKGLSESEAAEVIRQDRKILSDWIAASEESDSGAHFILGWMMMGGGSPGSDDAIATLSDIISDLPMVPPGRQFGTVQAVKPVESELLQENGNLFLYVSNSCHEPKEVDIQVAIDGQAVVSDIFEHQFYQGFTRYRIALKPGEHQFEVTSKLADVNFEQLFHIGDELHASFAFFYASPSALEAERPPCFIYHAEENSWIPEHGWKAAK